MKRFIAVAGVALVAAAGAAVSTVPVTGQARSAPPGDLPGADTARAFAASRMAEGFVPPKTPWGDPDLQGNFNHGAEANTPMERPDAFAGKRIQDVRPEEIAAAAQQRLVQANRPRTDHPGYAYDNTIAVSSRPWFVIDPADGKVPPFNASGQQRAAAARANRGRTGGFTDLSLRERCFINRGVPDGALPGPYGNTRQILQTKDYVVMRMEQIHETRFIPLDGRPLTGLRSRLGESRGHFDGNTLVVVTTGFRDLVTFQGSGPDLRVIERFTRTAPDKVEWTVTIDDPSAWNERWTFTVPLTEDDDEMILEFACQEGNYAAHNILSGLRADEARARAAGGAAPATPRAPTGGER